MDISEETSRVLVKSVWNFQSDVLRELSECFLHFSGVIQTVFILAGVYHHLRCVECISISNGVVVFPCFKLMELALIKTECYQLILGHDGKIVSLTQVAASLPLSSAESACPLALCSSASQFRNLVNKPRLIF